MNTRETATSRTHRQERHGGRFVQRFREKAVEKHNSRSEKWAATVKPLIGLVMAATGSVLIVTAVDGHGWTTPAVLDPYIAVLMIWNLAAFWVTASNYENATGWRRIVTGAGVVIAASGVLAATLRVLLAILFVIAVPLAQPKGERW